MYRLLVCQTACLCGGRRGVPWMESMTRICRCRLAGMEESMGEGEEGEEVERGEWGEYVRRSNVAPQS